MTLRAALYARYSCDQQRAASIEDQFRVCRERAGREGWKIAGAYKDSTISGDSMILRPGIQALLEDARRGMLDVVVVEALDQADVATLYKHLRFAGVTVVTLAEGEISELHVGLKGTMNALFLKDLAAKTQRGLRGRVEAGKSGGGLCYGYDVVKSFDGSGDPVRGGRTFNETEAEVVRRVFREFADGASPRAIARGLNGEGVPGPSGKLWMDTTIRGLIERIVLTPSAKWAEMDAVLHGDLGAILEWTGSGRENTKTDIPMPEMSVSVVSGAGFEPATFRL